MATGHLSRSLTRPLAFGKCLLGARCRAAHSPPAGDAVPIMLPHTPRLRVHGYTGAHAGVKGSCRERDPGRPQAIATPTPCPASAELQLPVNEHDLLLLPASKTPSSRAYTGDIPFPRLRRHGPKEACTQVSCYQLTWPSWPAGLPSPE